MRISIDTGVKEIEIVRNGEVAGTIKFSPADPALLQRLRDVSRKAEELQKQTSIREDATLEEALDQAVKLDKEIRGLVDWGFGSPVSDVVFGDSFSFTSTAGVSALEQFLASAMEYIASEQQAEIEASKVHQEKYLARYKK